MSTKYSAGSEGSSGSISGSVLERAIRGDGDAFRKITDLYSGLVYYWCRRSGLSQADADDTSQLVFMSVERNLGRFRRDSPNQSFRAWIRSITKSRIADHWRDVSRREAGEGGSDAFKKMEELPAERPVDADLDWELQELYQNAVQLIRQEFSERDFQAMFRVKVNGMTAKEAAAELGTTPNAIFIAISRIKRRVQEEFGDLMELTEAEHGS